MRFSTALVAGMAAFTYAQSDDLASLSSQLDALTSLVPTSIDSGALQSSLSDLATLAPSIQSAAQSAASSAVAEASADGSLSDISAAAYSAVTSLQQAFSTLDPAARSSVSAAFSSYGIDFASITSGLNDPLATGSSSDDDSDSSSTASSSMATGAQTTSARTSGSSGASAAQTGASTTDSQAMAAATALPIAAIGAGLAFIGML
jgi:hypothetical protein